MVQSLGSVLKWYAPMTGWCLGIAVIKLWQKQLNLGSYSSLSDGKYEWRHRTTPPTLMLSVSLLSAGTWAELLLGSKLWSSPATNAEHEMASRAYDPCFRRLRQMAMLDLIRCEAYRTLLSLSCFCIKTPPVLLLPNPTPSICDSNHNWNPQASVHYHSLFSSLLLHNTYGTLFAPLIVIITTLY